MRSLIALPFALLAGTAMAASAPARTPAAAAQSVSKAHVLSKAELDRLLEHPDRVLLVDVRRPDEQASVGAFPAFFSIQQGDVERLIAWIPRDKPIVAVSNHAGRASKTAELLASKGFKVIGAIGAESYEQAGGKVVRVTKPAEGQTGPAQAAPAAHSPR